MSGGMSECDAAAAIFQCGWQEAPAVTKPLITTFELDPLQVIFIFSKLQQWWKNK